MAGMNVGLISGMDTAALISQLIRVEANPQTLLKIKLGDTKADATAYRAVNTKFDALRTAAEAMTKVTTWAAAKASSSSPSVVATAGAAALPGSFTFTVDQLATAHSVSSAALTGTDPSSTSFGSSLTVTPADGSAATTLPVGGTGSLADAVSVINTSGLGLTAAAVKVADGQYRLQVTATSTGEAKNFSLSSDTGVVFSDSTVGKNAVLTVGTDSTYTVTSGSNTFSGLLPDTTITVSEKSTNAVTVTVASDPEAIAVAVEKLVAAANDVLTSIKGYTDTSSASAAVLKGDSTLRRLSSQVLEAVSTAIGTASAAQAGIQLNREGGISFDKATFLTAVKSDPALAQRLVSGAAATDPNGIAGDGDDTPAVEGVAQRLFALAAQATDTTTGTLTLIAQGRDALATDLTVRIEDWDLRLAARRTTLERQFTAMETALGTLQSQSSWLSAQLSSLPRWSSSDS
jgi:flagellar hook-associated protein 2